MRARFLVVLGRCSGDGRASGGRSACPPEHSVHVQRLFAAVIQPHYNLQHTATQNACLLHSLRHTTTPSAMNLRTLEQHGPLLVVGAARNEAWVAPYAREYIACRYMKADLETLQSIWILPDFEDFKADPKKVCRHRFDALFALGCLLAEVMHNFPCNVCR